MNNNDDESKIKPNEPAKQSPCENESRRIALKKLGRFAAYTAPVMMTLTSSMNAVASP
jgi:hypothetical protein